MPSIRELPPNYFDTYQSPFAYKYGSERMRNIWGEKGHWLKVRDFWIKQAEVQMGPGLVSKEEYEDLVAHRDDIDVREILLRENDRKHPKYTGHNVVAAISELGDKAEIGARIIHQGDTSEDPLSNVEVELIKESMEIVETRIESTLDGFAGQIIKYKDMSCVGWTHDQAAEPTTVGYRLARYAQDLLMDLDDIRYLKTKLKGKGMKGTVGTSASFTKLLEGTGMTAEEHEKRLMEKLGLEAFTITGQTYPRKLTMKTIFTISSVAQSCYQFARDVKALQGSPFNELAEPRPSEDVGSSAMPWKRNPRHCENIKSLSRGLISKTVEAWMGASDVTFERGLEDSGGKRSYLPESFLAIDEILTRTERLIRGIQVREKPIKRNLNQYGPFFAIGEILQELCKKGVHRQEMHEFLRQKSYIAAEAIDEGEQNPLRDLICNDESLNRFLSEQERLTIFDSAINNVGDAPKRCVDFVEKELYPAIKKEEK